MLTSRRECTIYANFAKSVKAEECEPDDDPNMSTLQINLTQFKADHDYLANRLR